MINFILFYVMPFFCSEMVFHVNTKYHLSLCRRSRDKCDVIYSPSWLFAQIDFRYEIVFAKQEIHKRH